ncbi:MAG: hypothetical protein PHY30_00500 [Candidatus Pacebacteria bacterium]|nr:hypothetical protein [Candidatus Paceibacterota bacterium]
MIMKNYIENLIKIIKVGTREEVKQAQKKVEEFFHNVYIESRDDGEWAFSAFLEELKTFEEIKDIEHQAWFINTLKWPIYAIGEENFERWSSFLLNCVRHPSGKIRQAAIRAIDNLIIFLRLDKSEKPDSKNEEFEEIVDDNRKRFGCFVLAVEKLTEEYNEKRFNRYKYINNLPVGVYKSLQSLLVDVLLKSEFFENIYKEFLEEINEDYNRPKITEESIIKERKEAEKQLENLVESTNSELSLQDVKDIIFNEKDRDGSMKRLIDNFNKGQEINEWDEILQIIVKAWNYWPHKRLNGLCPAEKVLEYQQREQ